MPSVREEAREGLGATVEDSDHSWPETYRLVAGKEWVRGRFKIR